MDRLSKDRQFEKVVVFVLDFDSGKESLRQLGIRQQSTLVAFKGKTETRRSVASTDPDALRKVFEAAL